MSTRKLTAGVAVLAILSPAAFGGAILDLFVGYVTEQARILQLGGYFPQSDPTMIRNESGTSASWTRDGQDYLRRWADRGYADEVRVNGSKNLSTCPAGSSCAWVSNPNTSHSSASGHADASSLALGVYGRISSNIAGAEATAGARLTNGFLVEAGGSGLELGDPVTLRWDFHFDGSSNVGSNA